MKLSSARIAAALVLSAAALASARADDAVASPWRFSARHTVLAYMTQQAIERDGPYNRANRLAAIGYRLTDLEWREDLRLDRRPCRAQLDLRVTARRVTQADAGIDRSTDTDAYVRTASAACDLGSALEVRLGREVLMWGNATLRAPSNPFFVDTGKTEPVRELLGKDLVQAIWRGADNWSAALVRQTGIGARDTGPRPFRATTALRLDHVGATSSAGWIAAAREGGPRQLGGYLTHTLSDAWLVYGDAAWVRGGDGWYAQSDASTPVGWRFVQAHAAETRWRGQALAGAAYTFESGWSLTGEALYNGSGYSSTERLAAARAADAADALWQQNLPQAAAGAAVLGQALQPQLMSIGRHYLFLQLLRTDWGNRADVALRWTRNLDDHSQSIATSVTFALDPHLQLLVIANFNSGPASAEFGRLVRRSGLVGIKAHF